jgi:hypothetical protein
MITGVFKVSIRIDVRDLTSPVSMDEHMRGFHRYPFLIKSNMDFTGYRIYVIRIELGL